MELEARQKLESLVTDLESFIGSKVHEIFVSDTKSTIEVVEEGILDTEITSIDSLFYMLELRGQRKVLRANITTFEDTVKNLKDRIQASLDEEQEISHNQTEKIDEEL